MAFSSIPVQIAVIFGFIWFVTRRLHQQGVMSSPQRDWMAILLAILLLWVVIIGHKTSSSMLALERLMDMLPGYWLPYLPIAVTLALAAINPPLREGLRSLAEHTPAHWLSGIQMVRIFALGSLLKASQDQFPLLLAWIVGLPDLLFGLSAIVVTWQLRRGRLSAGFLMRWHLAGVLVILLPLLVFMPLFMRDDLFEKWFEFPMIFEPSLLLPTLMMLNLLVVWRIRERAGARD